MYVNINLKVIINEKLSFTSVQKIEIKNTLQKLSNTASVVLPRAFKEAKGKRLLDIVKVSDSISIELGYQDELFQEFQGYITEIGAEIPTVLTCEDEMYKLKRTKKFNHTFCNCTLKQIIEFIAPGYQLECMNMSFGKFMIESSTAFEVLEGLKKFGVRCCFKQKVLHANTLVEFKTPNSHKFEFGKNIRHSSDLKYKTKAQRECKIKAISIQKGTSKRVTYEFGNNVNGERTFHAPLNLNKSELKEFAESHYKSVVFEGYQGSLHSWAIPRTEPGDTLELIDPNYEDNHRDGKFLIEDVTISCNATDGIKRVNTISLKL